MFQNHYTTLGLDPDALPQDIKKAYRKKAVKHHPDKPGGSSIEFEAITEAYKTLSDPVRREAFDQLLIRRLQKGSKPKGASDLRIVLKASMVDFVRGATKNIVTRRKGLCRACKGTGAKGAKTTQCLGCHGTGIDPVSFVIGPKRKCSKCGGKKVIPSGETCEECEGNGLCQETVRKQVKLAPHMLASKHMVLHGLGNVSPDGAGDLHVDFLVGKDPLYEVKGVNIHRSLEISPAQAILGDKVEISVFGEKKTVPVPPGAVNGQLVEMHKEGIHQGNRKGSLLVRLRVIIPDKITEDERKLYEKILELERNSSCLKTWGL